jgi:hypothetical protein
MAMTRVKFLLFALVVLGSWLVNLWVVAPAVATRAIDQASKQMAGVSSAVMVRVEGRRIELQRAALRVAGAPEVLLALKLGTKADPPNAERLAPVQALVSASLPEAMRPALVVGLWNEAGSIWAKGSEAPSTATDALDLAKVASAGSAGIDAKVFGSGYLFFSVPVIAPQQSEPKTLATVVVGAPSLPEGLAEGVIAELGFTAVVLTAEGQVLVAAGGEKGSSAKLDREVKRGPPVVVSRGSLGALGPWSLPFATSGDSLGGNAPLTVASRQPIKGTPFEVVSAVSLVPLLQGLADYQRTALFAFVGLLLLSVLFTAIIGSRSRSELEPEEENGEAPAKANQPAPGLSRTPAVTPEMELLPAIPEASPEDFQFPPSPPGPDAADLATPFDSPPAPSGNPPGDFDAEFPAGGAGFAPMQDEPPTAEATADPFSSAAGSEPPPDFGQDFNPDATRVSLVPEELLKASARPSGATPSMEFEPRPSPLPQMPAVEAAPNSAVAPEDQHFQDVYRDFVATRARCGEAAEGLTFDKFALKLKKNREQLVAKHACRTVRFQVYVKEGRAALKATPIKE